MKNPRKNEFKLLKFEKKTAHDSEKVLAGIFREFGIKDSSHPVKVEHAIKYSAYVLNKLIYNHDGIEGLKDLLAIVTDQTSEEE